MKEFPANIKFKYPWRKYQKRVLDELEEHLEDSHLHIIAPPGSGKTILGLEVSLRLNKPTLILAPTTAIRDQWVNRFCELFLQYDVIPDWISLDIKKPEFLTISTYQGMHAAFSGKNDVYEEERETESAVEDPENLILSKPKVKIVIEKLKNKKIKTIVVDEAHHLKNAWWSSLDEIKKNLSPTIVGLTATPPYDVTYAEWQRYIDLNGPVDAEISIPELVIEEDLCPHQDFIIFSSPTHEETIKIVEYNNRTKKVFDEIKNDLNFKNNLSNLPVFLQPQENLDWIYSNLEYYVSTLVYLNATGIEIHKLHLEIIGDSKFKIPKLNYEWLEILLTFYLNINDKSFLEIERHKESLLNKLKRNGIIERKKINFRNNDKRNKLLSTSISKLKSIEDIVTFESNSLNDSLRMVILTDYIRKEYLTDTNENLISLTKIGVMSIFEKLRRNKTSFSLGVLTGSIIIIPSSVLKAFNELCKTYDIANTNISQLPYDKRFLLINVSNKLKHNIVHIVTHLFQKGHIKTLIGTKSLLGEGWDAPAINSLILASFVGSYVSSNQMRGRAIRTQLANKNKTGNIWHLACIDKTDNDGGADLSLIKRRFKTFVGVSHHKEPSIENGIGRMNLPEKFQTNESFEAINAYMFSMAQNREELRLIWKKALENGTTLIEEMKLPFQNKKDYKSIKSLYFNRTIASLFGLLGSGLIGFSETALEVFLRNLKNIKSLESLLWWLSLIGVSGFAIFGRLIFKSFRLFIKYRDISKDIENISNALLESLINNKLIQTPKCDLTIIVHQDDHGGIYSHLKGASTFEKSLFIKSLIEIIGVIKSPRYLIIRKSSFFNLIPQKDYHSVPENLGKSKSIAQDFKLNWEHSVGKCDLIFTRNIKGRKLLLRSRINSLASEFEDKVERINKWE